MITSIARFARLARQARALSVPLVVAGALAIGCGTVRGSDAAADAAATSSASATPVPTVTGGRVVAGEPACVGWPANAPHATLSAFFDPVAAERCVTGFQQIPGKGEWQTATLEKDTRNLGPLIDALLRPSTQHKPGTACPDLAILPPQVVLINSAGQELIPRLPLSGCGMVNAEVLTALDAMSWQPVSVRLVAQVDSAPAPPGSRTTLSPKVLRTVSGVAAPS